MWTQLLLFALLTFVKASTSCFVDGEECLGGSVVDTATGISSLERCLEACGAEQECQAVTYFRGKDRFKMTKKHYGCEPCIIHVWTGVSGRHVFQRNNNKN